MKSYSLQQFGATATQIRLVLGAGEDITMTADGEPIALVLPVHGDLDVLRKAVLRARAAVAIDAIREDAAQRGLDKLTDQEIDDIISEVRTGAG
ncbi:MAG: hypothetical protein EXR77_18220 [Myxococcales bacterium]|nr:hypothetical protein [Myxococcales bacterium]